MERRTTYRKPELVSRKIQLGVFGDYGPDGRHGPDKRVGSTSSTTDIIGNLGVHME